jgi:hypothetical protein
MHKEEDAAEHAGRAQQAQGIRDTHANDVGQLGI